MEDNSPLENDELSEYDIYGKTPPRTKILRKNRERKQRDKQMSLPMSSVKFVRANPVFNRRNTVSSFYQDALKDDRDHDLNEGTKRGNKRHMKLLRGSERDLKLDIASAQARSTEKANKNPDDVDYPKTPSYQIESSKRFMSLMCRTYPCNKLKTMGKLQESDVTSGTNESICDENEEGSVVSDECSHARVEFYHTLKVLIRMGSGDKSSDRNPRRGMSKEETLWQNELKDVIWLELQAYHAERTPMDEDAYLCSARDIVEPLLDDIKNYRFRRHLKERRYLTENSDSGMEEDCAGCLSIYCLSCMEAQNEALRDVENLLKRLEDAESLFPSSKAFAELYPLYSSVEIVGRVKAMCLWYNMTKHQRLKLNILGRLLTLVDNKHGNWSVLSDDSSSSGSPSDSNNSTQSSSSDFGRNGDHVNVTPIAAFLSRKDENKVSPYRRYIENVLKTRALDKSLNFLRRLHENVLMKTQLTLDMPNDESMFSKNSVESEEEELRRYGSWSPEAKTLHLPSYRSMFIFLSMVPLEVVHEYLLMRLEQKPENPSPLSIRQLMRELKDGLRVAIEERVRSCGYIESATYGTNNVVENFIERVESVDECISRVFTDYLDYLQQWVLLHKNTFQKNLLEEEYQFSCYVCKFVPDGKNLMGSKFSFILGTILQRIGDRLILRIEEVFQPLSNIEEGMIKQNLFSVCRQLQSLFNEEREMSLKAMAFFKMNLKYDSVPSKCLNFLIVSIIAFKCIIPNAIAKVQGLFDHDSITSLDDIDKNAVNTRIREILMQVYRFGFDLYKEMSDSTPVKFRCRLVESMIDFANLWMKFVTERCERGRGMRPRWAYQGMEFLLTVCEPENTRHLTEEKFENLKKDMDVCISHVIGTTAPSTPDSGFHTASPKTSLEQIRARSRGSSPSPRPTYKSQRSGNNRKPSVEQQSPGTDTLESANSTPCLRNNDSPRLTTVKIKFPPKTHSEHWREALETLEIDMDNKLRKQKLIGKVLHDRTSNKNVHRRNVTFSWQRGIKIGQGRFGKVYTAVNNNTGDMMAVKEIALQHNDSVTIKRIAEEMKILEGIVHKNLLKYYGVEVHKDEMLIFMEYCSEGTLENLIAATERGLPELLVRRYTFQLVSGVGCLHHHGIVHRDIKTANIFLTNEGNCLKIGDFGCAAKIMANTTMPGELKGFVGTQAYMAPEVFTKNMSEGHGRAADIWSVGCVVVEMASGERPWAQYDSNYQIMFKVGMGQSPNPPDDMIDEGLDFLDMCFRHDPKERATARELLTHNFVKAGEDLN